MLEQKAYDSEEKTKRRMTNRSVTLADINFGRTDHSSYHQNNNMTDVTSQCFTNVKKV